MTPASGMFIWAVASDLVASGVGVFPPSGQDGVAVQVNYRRDVGAQTYVLLYERGGVSFPREHKEQQDFQVMVDSGVLTSAQVVARQVYDQLNERLAECFGDHMVLWLRSQDLPQAVPVGPVEDRYQFSINFSAMLVLG